MSQPPRSLIERYVKAAAFWFGKRYPDVNACLYGSVVAYYYGLQTIPPRDIDLIPESVLPRFSSGYVDQNYSHDAYPFLMDKAERIEGNLWLPRKEVYIAVRLILDSLFRSGWIWGIVESLPLDDLVLVLKEVNRCSTLTGWKQAKTRLDAIVRARYRGNRE